MRSSCFALRCVGLDREGAGVRLDGLIRPPWGCEVAGGGGDEEVAVTTGTGLVTGTTTGYQLYTGPSTGGQMRQCMLMRLTPMRGVRHMQAAPPSLSPSASLRLDSKERGLRRTASRWHAMQLETSPASLRASASSDHMEASVGLIRTAWQVRVE